MVVLSVFGSGLALAVAALVSAGEGHGLGVGVVESCAHLTEAVPPP